MRFIGKLLVFILLLLLTAAVALYFVLQTSWGAERLSRLLTENSKYQVRIASLSHDWSVPGQIRVTGLRFMEDGQHEDMLTADQAYFDLSLRQLTDPLNFARIQLADGNLRFSAEHSLLPVQADQLLLRHMSVTTHGLGWDINGQQVDAVIAPWAPQTQQPLGTEANFSFNVDSANLQGFAVQQLFIKGQVKANQWQFSTIDAQLDQGALTASATRNAQGEWTLDNVRLDKMHLQTPLSLADIQQQFSTLPPITVNQGELVNARLEGPGWSVNNLNLSLQQVSLQQGDWRSEQGSLTANAEDLVLNDQHLIKPDLQLSLSAAGVNINSFTTTWQRAEINATGSWQRADQLLHLNRLQLSGLEYGLPEGWLQQLQQRSPDWLAGLKIDQFATDRNLVVDTNPSFPFQLTSFSAEGQGLLLARDHQWGLWGGSLTLAAKAATFNKIDLLAPQLKANADNRQINVTQFSAGIDKGQFSGQGAVSQQAERAFSLLLNGQQMPLNSLQRWGWPVAIKAANGQVKLTLNGQLTGKAAISKTLQGNLEVNSSEGTETQHMQGGAVSE